MNFWESLLPKEIISAIGWTILHSVWQGILVGLLLAAALFFLNKRYSKIRSFLSAASLFLMVILFCVTLGVELNSASSVSSEQSGKIISTALHTNSGLNDNSSAGIVKDDSLHRILGELNNYLNSKLPFIFTFWLLGLILFSLKLTGGLIYTRRIKYSGTNFVPAVWQNRLNSFRYRLKIQKPIRLLESMIAKVPMVIGYVKPVILLPVGTLNGMPAEQVEVILIHELAHIYRNDYLINILQSIVETIFFYHPVVWWISSIVREEREKNCDDITIGICSDTFTYAKALTNLQEVKMKNPKFALSLFGKKKNLLERIKRLVTPDELRTSLPERLTGLVILSVFVFSTIIYSNTAFKHIQNSAAVRDTSKVKAKVNKKHPAQLKPDITIMKVKPGTKDTAAAEIAIKAPASPLPPNVTTALPKLPAPPAPAVVEVKTGKLPLPPAIPVIDTLDSTMVKVIKINEDSVTAAGDSLKKIDEQVKIINEKMKRHNEQLKQVQKNKLRKIDEDRINKEKDLERAEQDFEKQEKELHNKTVVIKEKEYKLQKHEELMRKKNTELLNSLRAELMKDDLIHRMDEGFNLDLSKDTLLVNGKMQNQSLLKKYKELIKQKTGNKFSGNDHFKVEIKH